MKLIKIAPCVFVDPSEVVSVERDTTYVHGPSPSDTHPYVDFDGSRVTLKSGRKLFVRDVFPEQIIQLLQEQK